MKRLSLPPAWRYVVIGLVVSVAAAFSIVNMASAHAGPTPGAPSPEMHGAGFGGPGVGLPGMPFGPMAGPGFDRMLDQLQATDAQRDQLHRIAESLHADLKPTADASRADHARMAELFAQPTVDAAALEALRKKMLARHDQVTKRMNLAMLDAAKVLTVEQRQQMLEQMKQRSERHAERRAERTDGTQPDQPPR
jgi:protein CpxP